jgi:hypothetical protein
MVFFNDTGLTDTSAGTPNVVLKVQRGSGDGTGVLKGVTKG